jgi:hypothetical protein
MNRNVKKQISEDNAVTVRPPSTALLGINSADREIRVGNYSPASFSLTQGSAYMNGEFTRVALSEVRLDYITPTLFPLSPLQIVYKTGGTLPPVTVVLNNLSTNQSWITCSAMAPLIQAEIRAQTPMTAFTMTFNNTAEVGAYVFQADSNTTDTFYFAPAPTIGTANANYGIDPTNIYFRMNWSSDYTTQPFATQQDTGVPCLLQTRFLDVVCEQLTYPQDLRDSSTQQASHDSICRLYLSDPTVPYYDQGSKPFTIIKDYNTPKQIKWNPGLPLANMSFKLLDDQGQVFKYGLKFDYEASKIYVGNWCITLLVTEN